MIGELHPSLAFLLAAILGFSFPRAQRVLAIAGPLAALAWIAMVSDEARLSIELLGQRLELVHLDALSRLFVTAFALFALAAAVYGWRVSTPSELRAGLILAGGAIGVVLAEDLLSLFLFWEWLTFASLWLIWLGPHSRDAGYRYLAFHSAGGMILLAGILLDHRWLILIGFLANAAVPPLHPWLPDAYPRARIAGSVWLTAFTTKSAVYALARWFPGTEVLAWAGAGMAVYGVLFALLENDVRRLLSYHIVSQVGFMVAGVGLGSALAINGATAHAFSHIFYKGLLMMCAGAVIHATGREKLAELGGLRRSHLPLLLLFALGAFSISGVPPFNGFISKSMTIAAAHAEGFTSVELILLFASVGTFLSITGKLLDGVFFGEARATAHEPVPTSMYFAMGIAGLVCVSTGVAPDLLYFALPNQAEYQPYSMAHLLESLELILGAALVFGLVRRRMSATRTVTRDLDRMVAPLVVSAYRVVAFMVRAPSRMLTWSAVRATEQWFLSRPSIEDRPVRIQVAIFVAVLVLAIAASQWAG